MTRRNPPKNVTFERLRECVSYDVDTGVFRWLVKRPGREIGDVAGTVNNQGYLALRIGGKFVSGHRAAWLYVTGGWPEATIDHIDGNRLNNAFKNLREATKQQNGRNNCGRGYCVDSRHPRTKYVAYIYVDRKQIRLGVYTSAAEARAAYLNATRVYFGEFSVCNRGGEL